MKKKILFVLNQMGAGGIAKSLSNLLFHLGKYKDKYEVDLFLLRKDGCYMVDIPDYVNVLESRGVLKLFGASQRDTKKFGKWAYFCRFVVACWTKIFGNFLPLKIGVKQNRLKQEYDAAVSFTHTQGLHDMAAGSLEFVLNGIKSKKKICFIHSDVVREGLISKSNIKKFSKFDKVFCVSESCSKQIVDFCPELKNVSDYLYNTQRNDIILSRAEEDLKCYKSGFNLVMVSRLGKEKGFMRFLPIIKKLHNEGFAFTLNIVGDGVLKCDIENYIKENNMDDYVVMHGYQSNPYPYIKHADLFVLVSHYEAAPMVYNEAQILQTPVFTTNVVSAKELVGKFGFVCENNEREIYNKLKEILLNKSILINKRELLKTYTFDNDLIVKKLLKQMEQ